MGFEIHEYATRQKGEGHPSVAATTATLRAGPVAWLDSAPPTLTALLKCTALHSDRPGKRGHAHTPTEGTIRKRLVRVVNAVCSTISAVDLQCVTLPALIMNAKVMGVGGPALVDTQARG